MSMHVNIDGGADEALKKMANDYIASTVLPKIVEKAKRIVPVESGHLQESIHQEVSGDGMFIVADAEYAAFVELGTSKQHAQPYLRPAITTVLG